MSYTISYTVGSSSEEDSGEGSGADTGDEPEEEEEQDDGDDDDEDEGTSFLISGKSVEEVHAIILFSIHMWACCDHPQACQTEQGLSDVAAAAEQLQPKGITLSTTKVTAWY